MNANQIQSILTFAKVPEHSVPLMQNISGGKPLIQDDYLFFYAENWIIALSWPLKGSFNQDVFRSALKKASEFSDAEIIYAAGPVLPDELKKHIAETDRFYVLSVNAPVPKALKGPIAKAQSRLKIEEGKEFTSAHRKLWAECMKEKQAQGNINSRVLEMYAKTPEALKAEKIKLLNAWKADGTLAASLLLDYNPQNFCAYIIGAHSRKNYVPHATDALFAQMIKNSKNAGKRFIHLGLGVNPGILRFKQKWGAVPASSYVAAQWNNKITKKPEQPEDSLGRTFAYAILKASPVSARQQILNAPSRKPYAMLWRVEKRGKISWLGGTAHFFCHSFETSFRKLFQQVENVLFEGPLDVEFMGRVQENGMKIEKGQIPLIDKLTSEEINQLEKIIQGKPLLWSQELRKARKKPLDIRFILAKSRPWHAFFTLWTAFLENRGWHESVDMEAWKVALDCDKKIIAMENLEEQLDSLNSLPEERVLRFFRDCKSWKRRAALNERAYLAGNLELMMGSSAEFPTRTEHIVSNRDQRFRERMRPWLERGGAAVFVGTAHLVNLRHMLKEDGFQVKQMPFGIMPKLRLLCRNYKSHESEVKW